jgi:hypothetical protein
MKRVQMTNELPSVTSERRSVGVRLVKAHTPISWLRYARPSARTWISSYSQAITACQPPYALWSHVHA